MSKKILLTEGFDFNSNIDTDNNDEGINTVVNDSILLNIHDMLQKEVMLFASQRFLIQKDKLLIEVNYQSKSFIVTYTSTSSKKYVWLAMKMEGNSMMIMLNACSPFDFVDASFTSTPLITSILDLAYLLVEQLKTYNIHHCVLMTMNRKVVYEFSNATTMFNKTDTISLSKVKIDKLPPFTIDGRCKILLNNLIFDDNETIDYFIDYLYKHVDTSIGELIFSIKTCTLKSEPMYGVLNNGRNPGTTSRYIRKSIKRYTEKKQVSEAFDFNDVSNSNDFTESINVNEYMRNENIKCNKHIKHLKHILETLHCAYKIPLGQDVLRSVQMDPEYNVKSMTYNGTTIWDYTLSLPDEEHIVKTLIQMQQENPENLKLYYPLNLPDHLANHINDVLKHTWNTYSNIDCTDWKKIAFFISKDNNIIIIASYTISYVLLTNTAAIDRKTHLIDPKTIAELP